MQRKNWLGCLLAAVLIFTGIQSTMGAAYDDYDVILYYTSDAYIDQDTLELNGVPPLTHGANGGDGQDGADGSNGASVWIVSTATVYLVGVINLSGGDGGGGGGQGSTSTVGHGGDGGNAGLFHVIAPKVVFIKDMLGCGIMVNGGAGGHGGTSNYANLCLGCAPPECTSSSPQSAGNGGDGGDAGMIILDVAEVDFQWIVDPGYPSFQIFGGDGGKGGDSGGFGVDGICSGCANYTPDLGLLSGGGGGEGGDAGRFFLCPGATMNGIPYHTNDAYAGSGGKGGNGGSIGAMPMTYVVSTGAGGGGTGGNAGAESLLPVVPTTLETYFYFGAAGGGAGGRDGYYTTNCSGDIGGGGYADDGEGTPLGTKWDAHHGGFCSLDPGCNDICDVNVPTYRYITESTCGPWWDCFGEWNGYWEEYYYCEIPAPVTETYTAYCKFEWSITCDVSGDCPAACILSEVCYVRSFKVRCNSDEGAQCYCEYDSAVYDVDVDPTLLASVQAFDVELAYLPACYVELSQ